MINEISYTTPKKWDFFEANIKKHKVLIITTTHVELTALHENLKPLYGRKLAQVISPEKKLTYYFGKLGKVKIVHVSCGDKGSGETRASLNTTKNAIAEC